MRQLVGKAMGFEFPFTSFEELMVAQASTAYPCDIWVKMPLNGRLDRAVFSDCVQRWLHLNPLLGCEAVRGWGGHRWKSRSFNASVRWVSQSNPVEFEWPTPDPLALDQGASLFFVVSESIDSDGTPISTLFLQFHHAQADGLGIIQALHELWLLYDEMVSGKSHEIPVRSIDDLIHRNRLGLTWPKLLRMLPQQAIGLAGVRQFLSRHPAPIVPHTPPTSAPTRVSTVGFSLSLERMKQLKAAAHAKQVSANECISAALFAGISQFRESREVESDSDWIRVMIPISMRSTHEIRSLSACNVVSAIFLDRTPAQVRDHATFLNGIHEEMELIKTNKLAFMFLFSVWLRKRLTWGQPKAKIIKRCETSFVFSNLGKVFGKSPLRTSTQELRAGNVTIKDFEILAPLNPYMISAFTFVQYGQRGKLTLRYDDRVLLESDANQLMQFVQQQLLAEIDKVGA